MRRRALLASATAAATGLAGCLAPVLGNPLPRRLSVVGAEAPELAFDAALLEPEVTVDRTARLRLTWTNTQSQEVALRLEQSGSPPKIEISGADARRTGLMLAHPSYEFAGQTWAGCWKLGEISQDQGLQRAVLAPDESLIHEYEAWTDSEEDGCFPPGEYQFGDFGPDWPGESGGLPPLGWTLTLEVEDA